MTLAIMLAVPGAAVAAVVANCAGAMSGTLVIDRFQAGREGCVVVPLEVQTLPPSADLDVGEVLRLEHQHAVLLTATRAKGLKDKTNMAKRPDMRDRT